MRYLEDRGRAKEGSYKGSVMWAPGGRDVENEVKAYAPNAIVTFVEEQKKTNRDYIYANLKLIWPVIEEALEKLFKEVPPRIVEEDGFIKPAWTEA